MNEKMPYAEADFLPLSALQHFMFCERQCALIHLEGLWAENQLTAEGRILHKNVHEVCDETRGDLRILRGLRLHSLTMGLYGVADVVECHRVVTGGVTLPAVEGKWRLTPVEYKRGRPKPNDCDRVQLCAQAMCLEEMLDAQIFEGNVFYGKPRRREHVMFDEKMRSLVSVTSKRLHLAMASGKTPRARFDSRCRSCSLLGVCLPKPLASGKSAKYYLTKMLT